MNNLCFLSNLTSSEWAAWVQAIGSIIAIVAAIIIAANQNKNALKLHYQELLSAKLDMAKTLLVLAENSRKSINHCIDELKDRETIYNIAEGHVYSSLSEFRKINSYLYDISLQNLPSNLVTPAMVLISTVRQFFEKIETALKHHREMDAASYDDLFKCMREMRDSVALECENIKIEISLLDRNKA